LLYSLAPEGPVQLAPATAETPAPVLAERAPEPSPPRPPRRSLADWLTAFMEERNILWGELVGGLLIVGCSIALVISLWQNLQEPVFQYCIFVSVTAALFGAGLYTLNHWKLESTSRGLLVIATLLVPLNLLALTTAQLEGETDYKLVLAECVSLAVFGSLLALTGKVLVPAGRWA